MYYKYPFIKKAKIIASDIAIDINEDVLNLGFKRMMWLPNAKPKILISEDEKKQELLSFLAERAILTYIKNSFLTNKYAVLESKLVFMYLQNETKEIIEEVASSLGMRIIKNKISLPDFLKFAPKDKHYRLIHRRLCNGWISLEPYEKIRIISEASKKFFMSLPKVNMQFNPVFEKYKSKLLQTLPKIKVNVDNKSIAPCMKAIIDMLRKHENVGHTGRWLLAVYLLNKRFPVDKIISLFANAPDYDKKKTEYQIKFAKNKQYKMPNCSSVASLGYCVRNCKIKNPLQWRGKNG